LKLVKKCFFDDTVKRVCRKNPRSLVDSLLELNYNISYKLISEIFLENIYDNEEACNRLINLINYNMFINNQKFLEEKINKISKKLNEELFNLLCTFFDVIIKKKEDHKDDNLYIIHGFDFLFNSDICNIFTENIKYIKENTPKMLEKIANNNKNNVLVVNPKSIIGSKQINILQNHGKSILLLNRNISLDLKGVEKENINKLINIFNFKTKILNNEKYPIDSKSLIDGLLINNDEESENIYHKNDLLYLWKSIKYKLLYFERYKIMKDKNFELSFKNIEIPNRNYLKCAQHIPTYLEEILEYKSNKSVEISVINKKLKNYIAVYDKTLSRKIKKNTVIDALLERDEWKNNLSEDNKKLLNYELLV
jgi:hypothetical protein